MGKESVTPIPLNVLLMNSIDGLRMLFVVAVEPALLKVLSQGWARTGISAFFPR